MGRRSWRSAALLAVGLVVMALMVARAAPSIGVAPHDVRDARSALAEAASVPVAQVASALELRRTGPDGGGRWFLTDLAALAAAGSLALVGTRRARQRAVTARTPTLARVPCGVRAPPAARA